MKAAIRKELYLRCKFERLNSKHNRLWDNFVKISIFVFTTYIGIIGTLLGFGRAAIFQHFTFFYLAAFIFLLIGGLVLSLVFDEIIVNRVRLNKLFSNLITER